MYSRHKQPVTESKNSLNLMALQPKTVNEKNEFASNRRANGDVSAGVITNAHKAWGPYDRKIPG